MANKTSHFGEQAVHSIDFDVADIEHFGDFADEAHKHLPRADVIFVDKPMFGGPYVMIHVRDSDGTYTLMVDAGQTLHIGETEVWVGTRDE